MKCVILCVTETRRDILRESRQECSICQSSWSVLILPSLLFYTTGVPYMDICHEHHIIAIFSLLLYIGFLCSSFFLINCMPNGDIQPLNLYLHNFLNLLFDLFYPVFATSKNQESLNLAHNPLSSPPPSS